MSLYDEFKAAFEEILAPELRAIRADLQGIRDDLSHLRATSGPLRHALIAEILRLDARIDALDQLQRPVPCARSARRCRAGRRRR